MIRNRHKRDNNYRFKINKTKYYYKNNNLKGENNMKQESQQAFFEFVKGKEIRKTNWDENQFLIPDEIEDGELYGVNHKGDKDSCFIMNGFEPYENEVCWEFYKKPVQPEYIPFTVEDAPSLIGRVIKQKRSNNIYTILSVTEDGVDLSAACPSFKTILDHSELLTIENGKITDTKPCGKLKHG